MSAEHLELVAQHDDLQAERARWAAVLAPAPVAGANCCDWGCDQSFGCPVRETRVFPGVGTSCCHRPDCADENCPGRPDRPPRSVPLRCTNSDGSDAGYGASASDIPDSGVPIAWLDELRYWLLVAALSLCCVTVAGLLVDYVILR